MCNSGVDVPAMPSGQGPGSGGGGSQIQVYLPSTQPRAEFKQFVRLSSHYCYLLETQSRQYLPPLKASEVNPPERLTLIRSQTRE